MSEKQIFTIENALKLIFFATLTIAGFMLVKYLSGVLLPFLLAITFAYILNPVVEFFQVKLRLKKRSISVLAALFLVIGIVWLIGIIITPFIQEDLQQASDLVKNYSNTEILRNSNQAWVREVNNFILNVRQNKEVMQWLTDQDWAGISKKLVEGLGGVASGTFGLISFLLSVFLSILYFVFALFQYDKFFGKWEELIPHDYKDKVQMLVNDVKLAMRQYFRAQTLVAFIVGVLFSIGFSIIGLPMAVVFGLLVGLLNLIPYLQLVALVPAAVLALLYSIETGQEFYLVALMVLLVFVVVQLIQEAILTPKIMGKTTGLSAVVILLGLSIWGKLLGFIGLLLAIPLTSLVLSYYKRFVSRKAD